MGGRHLSINEEFPGITEEAAEEIWALRATAEEGHQLLAEAYQAIAGIAGERLKPCANPCPGHLDQKAGEIYRRGLETYRAEA